MVRKGLSAIGVAVLSSLTIASAVNLEEWTLLTTQQVSRVAASSDRLVALGSQILHSTNATDWIPVNAGNSWSMTDIAYGNGRFVAVGGKLILCSSNGVDWVQSTLTSNTLYGVSFLNGEFLAVGESGLILFSPNGVEWQPLVSGTSDKLNATAFGNGRYFAVGEGITISTDGRNWNRLPGILYWTSLAFGQGNFVGLEVNSTRWFVSPDEWSWTRIDVPFSAPALASVRFVEGNFLFLGGARGTSGQIEGFLLTSTNGSNWTHRPTPNSSRWADAVFWNGTCIIVGDGVSQSQPLNGPKRPPMFVANPRSQIALSDRNVSFSVTAATWPPLEFQWLKDGQPLFGQTNSALSVVATPAAAGNYSVIATNAFGSVISSAAPLTVVQRIVLLEPATLPVTAGDDVTLHVPISGNTVVAYQWRRNGQNLLNETNATLALTSIQPSSALVYDVIVGNDAGAVTNQPYSMIVEPSQDHPLYHWTVRGSSFLPEFYLTGIVYGNGVFVTVAAKSGFESGFAFWSEDGKTWSSGYVADGGFTPFYQLFDVAFGNGIFVAVGWLGSIYSSTNGVSWHLRRSGSFGAYYDRVVFRDGTFWVGQTGGQTLLSNDGIHWVTWSLWPGYSGLPVSEAGLYATISHSPPGVLVSTNSGNWSLAYAGEVFDLAFGKGSLVAIGSGVIVQSEPLARIGWDSSRAWTLEIRGLLGRPYAIDHRDSLASTRPWVRLTTFVLSNNPTLLQLDPASQGSRHFYRTALLP